MISFIRTYRDQSPKNGGSRTPLVATLRVGNPVMRATSLPKDVAD